MFVLGANNLTCLSVTGGKPRTKNKASHNMMLKMAIGMLEESSWQIQIIRLAYFPERYVHP
jgi:hypothetical protein